LGTELGIELGTELRTELGTQDMTGDSGKGSWTGASDFDVDESSGGADVVVEY
jgi:hypothetical protein